MFSGPAYQPGMEAVVGTEDSLEADKAEEEEVEIDLSEMNEEEGFKVQHLTKFLSSFAIQIPNVLNSTSYGLYLLRSVRRKKQKKHRKCCIGNMLANLFASQATSDKSIY
jgi:hypothetical protein